MNFGRLVFHYTLQSGRCGALRLKTHIFLDFLCINLTLLNADGVPIFHTLSKEILSLIGYAMLLTLQYALRLCAVQFTKTR
jgi:hypothetical protein